MSNSKLSKMRLPLSLGKINHKPSLVLDEFIICISLIGKNKLGFHCTPLHIIELILTGILNIHAAHILEKEKVDNSLEVTLNNNPWDFNNFQGIRILTVLFQVLYKSGWYFSNDYNQDQSLYCLPDNENSRLYFKKVLIPPELPALIISSITFVDGTINLVYPSEGMKEAVAESLKMHSTSLNKIVERHGKITFIVDSKLWPKKQAGHGDKMFEFGRRIKDEINSRLSTKKIKSIGYVYVRGNHIPLTFFYIKEF